MAVVSWKASPACRGVRSAEKRAKSGGVAKAGRQRETQSETQVRVFPNIWSNRFMYGIIHTSFIGVNEENDGYDFVCDNGNGGKVSHG
jgi:hypothetical protein